MSERTGGRWYESVLQVDRMEASHEIAGMAPLFEAANLNQADAALIDEHFHDREALIYDSYCQIPRIREGERWILPWIRRATPQGVTLDLGCGTGRVAEMMNGSSHKVIAVDRSRNMLAVARRRLDPATTVALRADIHDLPVRDASVDAVICSGVLHHIPSWEDVVIEVARVLKPGGTLIVREPNANYAARLFEPLEKFLAVLFGRVQYENRRDGDSGDIVGIEQLGETLSPVERPIGFAELRDAATRAGLRLKQSGSAMFLGSLGLPDSLPIQGFYFRPANLLDRLGLCITRHQRGALVMAIFVKT